MTNCHVCNAPMDADYPSGVCSEACLRQGQGFPPAPCPSCSQPHDGLTPEPGLCRHCGDPTCCRICGGPLGECATHSAMPAPLCPACAEAGDICGECGGLMPQVTEALAVARAGDSARLRELLRQASREEGRRELPESMR